MRTVIVLFLLCVSSVAIAQTNSIHGEILDENGLALTSSTIVLLDPADSTMQYFGISGTTGRFDIKGIKQGHYLMQIAFIGYNTIYNNIEIPYNDDGNIGQIPMIPKPVSIDDVTVTAERIPIKILKDTLVYDAKAFKVAPDGVVEDLLKKLPGVEVDRAGNIKALGEDVNTVLVDGKEFFSGDHKVATKNLPADALDKVQVYNKKSEEAEFTGIDDGSRNQTINLVLDEDKKKGVFGEIMAGAGTEKHYQSNAKVYKFTDKIQVAALGMMNNINKFGFSIGDYLSFTGGIANISHGQGGLTMGGGGFPINFGETISGFSSSGAAGFNYSYSRAQNQRFFISYLGNGSRRELNESTKTTSYREADAYLQDDYTEQIQRDTAHNINFGTRYRFRETNNIIINGGLSFNTGYIPLSSEVSSYLNNTLINNMTRTSSDLSDRISGNVRGSYLKRINKGATVFKLFGNGSYSSSNSETMFENNTNFYNPDITSIISQFQNNAIKNSNYSGGLSLTQKLVGALYLDLSFQATNSDEELIRRQGNQFAGESIIDSLSPEFDKSEISYKPGISLRLNTDKSSLSFGLNYNIGSYNTTLWENSVIEKKYQFLQPRLSWEYRYKSGRRLALSYSTRMNTPSANQLLPVVNNFNPLSLYYGNRDLNPEYTHSVSASWWVFDEFSFTSLLTSFRLNQTRDKINYSRSIDDNLGQVMSLINVESDFSASGSIDFSTPIRFLGVKTNLSIDESYNKGINFVNDVENEITNIKHRISLSFDNRKKNKWDINTGMGLTVTDATYSIQESLNNIYYDISWFGEIRYTPGDKFEFNTSADITKYTADSFNESQLVPLLAAELSYFFMKNNRGTLSLAGYDLLNKNTGINRISEMNYLRERKSNIIGRYFMLSFKYRLNKVGGDTGLHVDIKRR